MLQTPFLVRKTRLAKYFVARILAAICALTILPLCPAANARRNSATATHSNFHGWKAIILRNRAAEVAIIPDIGRIMEFNLLDAAGRTLPGPFWSNPALDKNMAADVEGWRNYGGDKAWPAPQSEWPRIAGRAWPPPNGFDSVPFAATVKGSRVELVSPVDSIYGVRIRRTIALASEKPVLTLTTVYEKVHGAPVRLSVWTITQLASPDRAFILLPQHSQLPQGYVNLMTTPPPDLKLEGRLLSLTRDLTSKSKIGSDGDALLWVGTGVDLLLESKPPDRDANQSEWPDQGSHSQIYTSPGAEMKYVEFELLDRLHDLKPGEKASFAATYSLIPRTQSDPTAEARKIFPVTVTVKPDRVPARREAGAGRSDKCGASPMGRHEISRTLYSIARTCTRSRIQWPPGWPASWSIGSHYSSP
jgi:hypothetical protein